MDGRTVGRGTLGSVTQQVRVRSWERHLRGPDVTPILDWVHHIARQPPSSSKIRVFSVPEMFAKFANFNTFALFGRSSLVGLRAI
jgi:hypothetical protein